MEGESNGALAIREEIDYLTIDGKFYSVLSQARGVVMQIKSSLGGDRENLNKEYDRVRWTYDSSLTNDSGDPSGPSASATLAVDCPPPPPTRRGLHRGRGAAAPRPHLLSDAHLRRRVRRSGPAVAYAAAAAAGPQPDSSEAAETHCIWRPRKVALSR